MRPRLRTERMQPPLVREYLALERCPHCWVHRPTLNKRQILELDQMMRSGPGACALARVPIIRGCRWVAARQGYPAAALVIPKASGIDETIPEPAPRYAEGRLYDRINRAAGEHVITQIRRR
jgi:hypothetical protein